MAAVSVLGPGGYSRPPYGSFSGKPASGGRVYTQTFSVLGPGGYPRPRYGSFVRPVAPPTLHLTDTLHVNLPINCVLDGQQDYEVGDTEIETRDPAIKTRIMVSAGPGGRLSSNESSFSVKTGSRGYD